MTATDLSAPAGGATAGESVGTPGPRPLSMVVNALSVVAGKTATSGLGFLFWLIAAREFPAAQVGLAAGVVSAMMLCTQLALLGVGSSVITHFPRHQAQPASLLNTSFTIAGLAGLVAGGAFVLLASGAFRELSVVGADPVFLLLFLAMSVLGTVQILLDQVSVALRRGEQVFVRGVLFGCVTVLLLALVSMTTSKASAVAIFAPWVAAGACVGIMGAIQLWRCLARYRYRPALPRQLGWELMRVGMPNYALTLTERAPGLILPIVVTELLSPTANAAWYTVWMMAWVLYIIPISAGLALFSEGVHRPAELQRAVTQCIRMALLLGAAGALVLAAAAPYILSILGPRYAAAGTTPLRILVWAVLPLAFVQSYFAACRARQKLREAILTGTVSGLISIAAAAAVAPVAGLTGMAVSWLAVQLMTGAWALVRVRRLTNEGSLDSGDESSRGGAIANGRGGWARRAALRFDGVVAPASGAAGAWRSARGPRARARQPVRDRVSSAAGLVPYLFVPAAVILWAISLSSVNTRDIDGFGLVSALGPWTLVAFVILTASFCHALRAPARPWIMAGHAFALILMLHGVRPLVEHVPAFDVTWRHIGITEYITRTGHIDPRIDAYFSWPGFFLVLGLAAKLAGFSDASSLAAWAPVFYNLLYLGPLLVIFRSLTKDARLVWAGVWAFYLANWIGQDYLSPQGFVVFLHLTVLAIVLRWFMRGERPEAAFMTLRPVQRVGLIVAAIAIVAAIVPTHQLTPFITLVSLAALVIFLQSWARGLPFVVLILIAAWLSFMATGYLSGHFGSAFGQVGQVSQTVSSSVASRFHGSGPHIFVLDLRLFMTAALWAGALAGAVRAWRNRALDATTVLLAMAPFVVLATQGYGGEILLRVYLFSLPFMALLGARLLFPSATAGRSWWTTATVGLLSVAMVVSFGFTRYGNEQMDYFTPNEVAAVRHLYQVAPPGSVLIAGSPDTPWKFRGYEAYRYVTLSNLPLWSELNTPHPRTALVVKGIRDEIRRRGAPAAFLIFTRSQEAEVELTGLAPPGSLARVQAALLRSSTFRRIYANPDASIFAPVRQPGSAAP